MPKFYVPFAEDEAQAENVWQNTKKFHERHGATISDRRIYSIEYQHKGKKCIDVIGGLDRYDNEKILILLEADQVYFCCTANQGVLRGGPIYIGKEGAFVTEFES